MSEPSRDASTIIVGQYQAAASAAAGSNSYGGLRIHALPGLHECLAGLVVRHVPARARILDLAAGSGSMFMRLRDVGFRPHAADYVAENFKLAGVPFAKVDLNLSFADAFRGEEFGAIMASEIIEHLENPRHFLRECRRILGPDGVILLSTPNPENGGSAASFIRSGQFLWFSDHDYRLQGHITPLTRWQLGRCLDEAGFELAWEGSFGAVASKLEGSPRLRALAWVIDRVSSLPRALRGEIYICVARKRLPPEPAAGQAGPAG